MWSPADLVILVPMLGRPHRVEPLLASIHRATPGAHVLFLTTPDDLEVTDAIDQNGADRLQVPWRPCGDYARKINEGIAETIEPLIFTGADDLLFHPGWYQVATAFIEGPIGVVGTNDLTNKRTRTGQHSTHSLVTRDYCALGLIDGTPGLLYEGYPHEYVDDELVGTARHRHAFRHARDAHVEHLHPMRGKAPMDELYEQQAARMAAGRDLYHERRRMWE